MRPSSLPYAILAALCLASPALAVESVWSRLPAGLEADSLAPELRRIERVGPRATAAAAAFALGQFHHARGEYRPAADAFGRAAARLSGYDRAQARYRQGMACLGAREAGRARAAFEEVASSSQPLRAFAQLGLAQSFALSGEVARELDVLDRLLEGPAGEAEPAALERYAALCERLQRTGDAQVARVRLLRRWPRSFEAARVSQPATRAQP